MNFSSLQHLALDECHVIRVDDGRAQVLQQVLDVTQSGVKAAFFDLVSAGFEPLSRRPLFACNMIADLSSLKN